MMEALHAFSEVFLPIIVIAAVGYALREALPGGHMGMDRRMAVSVARDHQAEAQASGPPPTRA